MGSVFTSEKRKPILTEEVRKPNCYRHNTVFPFSEFFSSYSILVEKFTHVALQPCAKCTSSENLFVQILSLKASWKQAGDSMPNAKRPSRSLVSFWLTFCPSSEWKQIEKNTKLEHSPLLKANIHIVYVMICHMMSNSQILEQTATISLLPQHKM